MRNRAIAEYHDLLTADESLTADLFGRLKEGMSGPDGKFIKAVIEHDVSSEESQQLVRQPDLIRTSSDKETPYDQMAQTVSPFIKKDANVCAGAKFVRRHLKPTVRQSGDWTMAGL
jgi:hypothetical protein